MKDEPEPPAPSAAGRVSDGVDPVGPREVSRLLAAWSRGDRAALDGQDENAEVLKISAVTVRRDWVSELRHAGQSDG
jgi:hypothetical protein